MLSGEANIACLFDRAAREVPDARFLDAPGDTFARVVAHAEALAGELERAGLTRGDRVALRFENSTGVVEAMLGVWKLGAVPVMIGSMAPAPEIARAVDSAAVAALISSRDLADSAAAGIRQASACDRLLVYVGAGRLAGEAEPARPQALAAPATTAVAPGDPGLILFTSGTTGRPKGAVLSHANLHFIAACVGRTFFGIEPDDTVLLAASNAHIFGVTLILVAVGQQCRLVMLDKFEPRAFMRAVASERVSFTAGVPQMAYPLLSPLADSFDLSSLRRMMLGGDTVPPALVNDLHARFGLEVIVGYGMTEAVPVAHTVAGMKDVPSGAVGLPALDTEIRIVGSDERECPAGTLGEIEVRGPQVFLGYFGSESGAAVWRDDWFRTGDLGRIDGKGFLFHVDRLKNVVKAGGYSVYPAEVERVLREHPGVLDVAVGSRPHKQLGAVLVAFVVARPGAEVSAAKLIQFAKQQLAAFKVPRSIVFLDALPRNPIGKVDRAALAAARER